MFRSILVPVDFSTESRLVTRFVEGLSAVGVKRVVFAHIIEASGMEGPVIAHSVDKAREQLRDMTSNVCGTGGITCEMRVATGDAASQIAALATESRVDGIVCGSKGKTVLAKLFAGSVSEELMSHADRPTLLVRYDLLKAASSPGDVARTFGTTLLLPTDFSAAATRALLAVLDMQKGSIGKLVLLHVLDPGLPVEARAEAEQGARFQMRNMAEMAETGGIAVETVVAQGDPKKVILKELEARGATGLVTGTRGRGGLEEAVMGSVSLSLLRHASCPVLIVP